jgi:hypothetical protein
MKFRRIADQRETFPVRIMGDVMGVSPAGYYAWYYAWCGRDDSIHAPEGKLLKTTLRWKAASAL